MAPRERRLAVLGGFSLVMVIVVFIGGMVWDGMTALADDNDAKREAIRTMEEKREDLIAARSRVADPVAQIGEEALALGSYTEKISGEVGLQIKSTRPLPGATKGKYHEVPLQLTLYDVTLDQLARFLKRIETDSPIVATTRLFVKRSISAKEKLDRVEITVTTWEKVKAKKAGDKPAVADKEGKEEAP